ncbi:MAG: hypothetical protein ACR2II_01415 [Chthoniobacterales bacterium]
MKITIKSIFTAVAASAAITWCGPLGAQALAPQATLEAGPATEVQAEENYVMQTPAASYQVPFRSTMGASAYAAAKQAAANYSPQAVKPGVNSPAPAAPPTQVFKNFDGASDTDGLRPPDTHGAVGLKHFVETTNSHFTVFLKRTGSQAKNVTLANFFNYTARTLFDARVVYDSTWDRWIVTADAFAESSTVQRLFVGISKTSNPTKGFYIYNFNIIFNSGDFFDFPQLGIDQDSVLITGNVFGSSSFRGATAFAIAKARLYNGLGFSVPLFTGLVATLAPPIVLDQNASTFFLAAPSSGTTFTKYTMTNSSRPGSTAMVASSVTVPSYSVPPSAHQSGTGVLLDTSDSRFVNASTQNGTDLWQTHTVALGSFPAPKFYRINTSTNAVAQSGTYFLNGSSDDWNASIATNTSNNTFVTWTSTTAGSGVNAEVVFSGKIDADTSIPAGGVVGFTSPTFYRPSSDNPERWGDYSAVTIDPTNTSKAWLVNEKINTNAVWGSRIMQVGF